jgi:hypothetical protein
MAITDPILSTMRGFAPFSKFLIFSYVAFLVSVWLGRRLRNTDSWSRIGAFTIINSIQFFLLTNFGSWLWFQTYPKTVTGLVDCYVAAIPFFGWTLAGDAVYTAVLFGLYAWLGRNVAARERLAVA